MTSLLSSSQYYSREKELRRSEKIGRKFGRSQDILIKVSFPCFSLRGMNVLDCLDGIETDVIRLNADNITLKSTLQS